MQQHSQAAVADLPAPDTDGLGTVFDIQRYTVHDGPGTRTSVFLKGCPLHCLWCCNPESQVGSPEIGVYPQRCLGVDDCGLCLAACPLRDASLFRLDADKRVAGIDRTRCTHCFACVAACPADGLSQLGQKTRVPDLVVEVLKDRDFYQATGGGVTVSGGEAFAQPRFTRELLAACKAAGLHTCVESSLYAPWTAVQPSLPCIDFCISDIKHMDPEKHRRYTGGKLEVILENIKRLSQAGKQMIIRIPLIPRYNDDAANIHRTGRFLAATCGPTLQQVQVLQYHELGKSKYAALGQDYPLADLEKPSREDYIASVRQAVAILQDYGLPAHADSKLVMTR